MYNLPLTSHFSPLTSQLIQISPDSEFLVGKWCLEKETGEIAYHKDNQVRVYS